MDPASKQPNLTLHTLYQVLTWGIASNQQQIQIATNQLQEWQKQPSFHYLLQRIIGDQSLAFDVRWLAAIQLKNGIDKYWRKTAVNAISKEEKAKIRSRCIQVAIKEPDQRLAVQTAVFVAKIIRIDYPHDWEDAFSSVLEALRESTTPDAPPIQLSRSLLLLLTIIKELSTAKISRTRRSVYMVAPEVLQLVGGIYVTCINSWRGFLQQGGADEAVAIDNIEKSLLCLRLLRRLVVSCFDSPAREASVHEFWSLITEHFQFLLSTLRQHGQALSPSIKTLLERHVHQIAKLHLGMIDANPSAFPQLPDAIEIARAYWSILVDFGTSFGAQAEQAQGAAIGTDGDAEDEVTFMEKVSLRGLLLLRGCVKMVYNPAPTLKYQTAEDKQERIESKQSVKQNLLSEALVKEMMETLVTKYFVFRPSDLRRWQEEPDEWEKQEEGEGDSYRYSVRVCAEKLFLDLVLNHKDLLVEPLIQVFQNVATPQNTDILLKDSIYGAIGLSAPVLVGKLDLNGFMSSVMLPELQIQQKGYQILRRRAAIFLGQWMPVDPDSMDTALVYQIYQFLLDKSDPLNDLVVRVTAGRQVKKALNPYYEISTKLDPYLNIILQRLLELVDEVELAETKMALLNTVQTLIQTMGEGITKHADEIINRLPPIWDAAGDEFAIKQNILGLMSELFRAMKANSSKYHPLILPLINSALDLENENRLQLVEDAADLWSAVLSHTPESNDHIMSLLPHLYPLFDNDDTMSKAFEIADSYMLLGPQAMMGEPAVRLFTTFQILLENPLRRAARIAICDVIEQLLVVTLSVSGKDGIDHLASITESTGLSSCLIGGLMEAYTAHQEVGPRAPKTDIDGKVETKYWCVMSRFIIGSPGTLLGFCQTWSSKGAAADSFPTFTKLLTELFSHYESLGDPTSSKTVALATTALFGHNDHEVFSRIGDKLQDFLTLWTAAVHEWAWEGTDSLIWGEDAREAPMDFDPSPGSIRRHNLDWTEPVRRIDIRDAIRAAFVSFRDSIGGEAAFDECAQNVDRDVLEQFRGLNLFGP